MSDDIHVDTAALQRHAGDLSELMGHVRGATNVSFLFDPQTYGAIGMTWSSYLKSWTTEATSFINAAADCGDRVSEELANMAADYLEQEEGMKDEYQKILKGIDEAAE